MKFLEVFKESDGSWSWGRVASSCTLVSGIWAFVHVVLRTHTIPDATNLAGLMAWGIGPYGANKFATAFGKKDNL
jgi:hypothetical protein